MKERSLNALKIVDRWAGIPALWVLCAVRHLLTPFRRRELKEIRTILMVKLWGVGNLAMIIPLIRAVRRRFPRARIVFLTLESNAQLLRSLPDLDEVVTLATAGPLRTLARTLLLPLRLRRLRADLLLDFEQFLRATPLLGFLAGAAQRVGLDTPGQFRAALYHVKVPYRRERHMTRTFADVVRSAGADTAGLPALEVPRSPDAARRVERLLDASRLARGGTRPLVALHLGSGDNFPARRWPAESFAEAAAAIHTATGARFLLTGTARESPLAERFLAALSLPVANLVARLDLLELVELLARTDLLVSNDTAPVHIASALDLPLVAIYGPNTPDLYGPLHEAARAFYLRLPCSPCITNLNAKTSRCKMPVCITGIRPEPVADAAISLLAAGRRTRRREGAAP